MSAEDLTSGVIGRLPKSVKEERQSNLQKILIGPFRLIQLSR